MKIGIDIDGVLARFDQAYAELLTKETGLTFPVDDPNWPSTWYWEREAFREAGWDHRAAKAAENRVWETIKESTFWVQLLPYPDAVGALQLLSTLRLGGSSIYFITSRPGKFAKLYTEFWLDVHGMVNPTVLIAHNKGPVVQGLELDAFIDDRPENIVDALTSRSEVKAYIIDRPYNREFKFPASMEPKRVTNVIEAIDDMFMKEEKKAA